MKKLNYFLVLFFVFSQLIFSQQIKNKTYQEIRKNYEKMNIDEKKALPFVRSFIQKAKQENNHSKIIQGYRDGRQFDVENKMRYADSAINVSLKYGSKDDISSDYLSKGIIYYFYQKKYKLALNEYLKAYQYSKLSKDSYLHYKVEYHLGIVKGHLGYYEEALEHFEGCLSFFEKKMKERHHENEYFNYKKGYLNSLHQLTVINRYLFNYSLSDSLSQRGYNLTKDDIEFELENCYFLKCMAILEYQKHNYKESKAYLTRSLSTILNRNDFACATVIYYYLGKISEEEHQSNLAFEYYSKIDSIFENHNFILPEVSNSYKYLINYYSKKDINKQLYFTNQLLRADSIITKDYAYLSSTLHKNYDRQSLIEQKNDIERISKKKMIYAQILILLGIIVLSFLLFRYTKDRKIKKLYISLQEKIKDGTYKISGKRKQEKEVEFVRKTFLSPEMTLEISEKLEKFEEQLQFKQKGLTQNSIAIKLGTNSHYLSIYINENKGMNFNRYMAELRINYITNLLNTNTKYLNYRIEALADECGIAARQNFSNLFYEINGIRPTDYIKKRKEDLGIN